MSPTSKDQRLRILEEKLKIKEEKIIEIRGKLRVETNEKQDGPSSGDKLDLK